MDKTVFRGYLSLLIFAPLAFGATELWSLTLLETSAIGLTLLYLIHQWLREKKFYHTPGLLPLLLFLLYILFQLLPLPHWVFQLLSPETLTNYQNTIAVTEPSSWFSLSINKKATISEFYRYAAYISFYFLTVQILTSHKKLDLTVNTLLTFAPVLSTFAIIQYYTSKDTIYWLREVPVNSIIFGPYVNHNHFAGLIEMILPIAVAMFLCLKPRISYVMTWREKILDLFDLQGFNSYILVGFSAILSAVAIVLSLSRGAIISVGLALLIFTILLVISGRYRQKGWVFGIFILLFILSVQWFGWNTVFERFDRLQNDRAEIYETRFDIWKDSGSIARDNFISGIGFGNFKTIYPRYRTFGGEKSVLHAHNDYLELLVEGGIVSVLFVGWFLLKLFSESYRVYSRRHERYSIYLFLGSLTGIISILLHSFTDFNLHIGANGLFFFFLCGLLVSAANTRSRSPKKITYLRQLKYSFRLRTSTCSLTAILLISCLSINSGMMMGELHFASIKDIYLSSKIPAGKLKEINEVADKASFFDPLEGRYYYAIGNLKTLLHGFPASLKSFKK
ncbi:MAG: O-antigen ligase family protein, partial [Proteobacteria bacterium]|nr:O-antigen ligase family protein [Pseudomonadota bacterium]